MVPMDPDPDSYPNPQHSFLQDTFPPCFVPLMILPGDLDEGIALEPEPVDLVELPAGELEERLLLALQHLLRHNLDCAPRHAF
jgi:hypothetical protein